MSEEMKRSLPWSFLTWAVAGLIWGYTLSISNKVTWSISDVTILVLLLLVVFFENYIHVLNNVGDDEKSPFFVFMYKLAAFTLAAFCFATPDLVLVSMFFIVSGLGLASQFWAPLRNALKSEINDK